MRRDFILPEEDVEHLDALKIPWETLVEGGNRWLVLHQVRYPSGLNVTEGSVAIQIHPGYPAAPLDMAYFSPHLSRLDGQQIRQASVLQPIDGKQWQRWSRHYGWIPGQHNIGTHLVLVDRWLRVAVGEN